MNSNNEFSKIFRTETMDYLNKEINQIEKSSFIVQGSMILNRINLGYSGFAKQFEKRKIKTLANKTLQNKKDLNNEKPQWIFTRQLS
jgi:hypothetical protein